MATTETASADAGDRARAADSDWDHATVLRWAAVGAAFGLAFPIVGLLVASNGSLDLAGAHSEQSVLYIVDLAPLVLGVVGGILGRIHGRLVRTRDAIEETVLERTAELETALADLQYAHAQLVQAQKLEAIGSLAAGVAHEINTPIQYVGDNIRFLEASFTGYLSLQEAAMELSQSVRGADGQTAVLAKFDAVVDDADLDFLNEEIPSAAGQALEGVQRVSEIVRALKSFAHPGTATKEPVDVNKAVSDTLAVSRGEWKYVADVETDLDPEVPLVDALPGPLKQALLIIVVNAAQALEDRIGDSGGEKGRIVVRTTWDESAVRIVISDDAGGIPEHIWDRVFDPFFTTKEPGRGSGQGLGIARSAVVDQHGGDLTFVVEPDVGTTFTISVPR